MQIQPSFVLSLLLISGSSACGQAAFFGHNDKEHGNDTAAQPEETQEAPAEQPAPAPETPSPTVSQTADPDDDQPVADPCSPVQTAQSPAPSQGNPPVQSPTQAECPIQTTAGGY